MAAAEGDAARRAGRLMPSFAAAGKLRQIRIVTEGYMRAIATLLLALMLALGAGAATIGCSSQTTTTTETVEHSPNPDGTTTTTEVTKTEQHSDDDGAHFGILSGTVHLIGQILALPFKLIGGLFSVIF
jgi:hypothetical protein